MLKEKCFRTKVNDAFNIENKILILLYIVTKPFTNCKVLLQL